MGLRELRKELSLTQAAAAEQFSLTRNAYENYERRVREPPFAKFDQHYPSKTKAVTE